MSSTKTKEPKKQLCSVYSRLNKEDPGGSAVSWSECLVLELTNPWSQDVVETEHFPPEIVMALELAAKQGRFIRVQCIVPDPEYSSEDLTRVMYFFKANNPMSKYEKLELMVPPKRTGDIVTKLIESEARHPDLKRYLQNTSEIRELLICTHGSRDVCCASFGYPIYECLRNKYAGHSLRVWRTSHTGGHRLASNVIDMPTGRYWCRLVKEDLERLVSHDGSVSDLTDKYRGWAHMKSPWEQIAEREVLHREGWDWMRFRVDSEIKKIISGTRTAEVHIEFSDPFSTRTGFYDVRVEQVESAPTIECRGNNEFGETEQYVVASLEGRGF